MFDTARERGVAIQRKMRAGFVIIRRVAPENPTQVTFAKHDDVIQAFSPNRTKHPFNEGILPRRSMCSLSLFDAHLLGASSEVNTIDSVTIPHRESRRFLLRERFDDLLASPMGCGVLCHIEVNDPAPVTSQHDHAV